MKKTCREERFWKSSSSLSSSLSLQFLSNPIFHLVHRSAGSIGARSAPSTPLQAAPEAGGQQSISGSQLTVAGASYPQPPRSPSHAALKCNDRWGFRSVVKLTRRRCACRNAHLWPWTWYAFLVWNEVSISPAFQYFSVKRITYSFKIGACKCYILYYYTLSNKQIGN